MKLLILTALFPPDQDPTAVYSKAVTERLAATNEVTVLHYGRLPEAVEDVKFVSIDKRLPTWRRLWRFTWTLIKEAKQADIIYAINGSSVEFALAVAGSMIRTPVVLHLIDESAQRSSERSGRRAIYSRAVAGATKVILPIQQTSMTSKQCHLPTPLPRPEILPLDPAPAAVTEAEQSWDSHLNSLSKLFTDVRN